MTRNLLCWRNYYNSHDADECLFECGKYYDSTLVDDEFLYIHCHKNFRSISVPFHRFTRDKYTGVLEKEYKYPYVKDYFFTLQEIRKLKLNQLQNDECKNR